MLCSDGEQRERQYLRKSGPYLSAAILTIAVALTGVFEVVAHAGSALAQSKVGVTAAVRGEVQLVAQNTQSGRKVGGGEPVFLGDRIESGVDAGLQLLLLDETVFTIGPNTSIVIDRFIYDPNTGVGEVSAALARGVMRMVTGTIAREDPGKVEVRLPAGLIGVRGTDITASCGAGGACTAWLNGPRLGNAAGQRAGAFDVVAQKQSRAVRRPGDGVDIVPGRPPSEVYTIPKDLRQVVSAELLPREIPEEDLQKDAVAAGETIQEEVSDVGAPELGGVVASDSLEASDALLEAAAIYGFDKTLTDIVDTGLDRLASTEELVSLQGNASFTALVSYGSGGDSVAMATDILFDDRTVSLQVVGTPGSALTFGSVYGFTSFYADIIEAASFTNTKACGGNTCTGSVDVLRSGGAVAGSVNMDFSVTDGATTDSATALSVPRD